MLQKRHVPAKCHSFEFIAESAYLFTDHIIKYPTIHGKVQGMSAFHVAYNVHQSDSCISETIVQVGIWHQAGLLS